MSNMLTNEHIIIIKLLSVRKNIDAFLYIIEKMIRKKDRSPVIERKKEKSIIMGLNTNDGMVSR